ncbi:MAG TPA: nucleotidyl transferase AbiEii/AbiGii toxin family protein [Candidatus Acidoferrales bacterium]|nr:nucleotidyl transferase AbiEii/AbiGii toxin family protein [Candidatus Acidoferrales bacterium]
MEIAIHYAGTAESSEATGELTVGRAKAHHAQSRFRGTREVKSAFLFSRFFGKMKTMHVEILDVRRKKLLPKFGFLNRYGFYLAGGTALALQIGHRTSLDFDFYTKKDFDPDKLLKKLETRFEEVVLLQKDKGTLIVTVDKVAASFFQYQYQLIKPLREVEGVKLASKEDIGAMKIVAVTGRGTERDFVDLYFLLREFSLDQILKFTKKKYPQFNIYVGLRSLTYFADAEKKQARKLRMLKPVSWNEVKKRIVEEVKRYQNHA